VAEVDVTGKCNDITTWPLHCKGRTEDTLYTIILITFIS